MSSISILGIAGSLRRGSFNRALLEAASGLVPEGVRLETAGIEGIPLYDADLESSSGIPETVERIKQQIHSANGLLLVTPEYNNSLPGPMKNAIDWLTRPPREAPRLFRNLPVGVIGASAGKGGTRAVQAAWLPVLRALGTSPWFGSQVAVAEASKVFDSEGRLVSEEVAEQLRRYLEGFSRFIGVHAGLRVS